jgi:hypothetical protein
MDMFSEEPENSHPPLSPATGAESLFLAGLATSSISANALAYQLQKNQQQFSYSSDRSSVFSAATDDFASAVGNSDELLSDNEDEYIKTHSSIPELHPDDTSDEETEETTTTTRDIMATKTAKVSNNKASATKPAPKLAPGAPPADDKHVDVAAHVYEGAKDVWAWGKGKAVFSPFLGLAEAVAGKVVGVAGTNLEDIDGNIKPQLKKIDNGILNPAIEKLVGIVLGAVGKTEDIFKPIIIVFLTPFGLIKEEKKGETPEASPEVTAK